jgi:hypothetical protein
VSSANLNRTAVGGTAILAAACAMSGAVSWLYPEFLASAVWLLIVAFLGVFAGFAVLVLMSLARFRNRERGGTDRPSQLTPRGERQPALRRLLVAVAACGVASAAAGLITTGGWSADSRRNDPACTWRIVKDHGSTVQCVSHGRWLQVQDGVERGILGFLALFASIECWKLASLKPDEPA